MIIFNRAQQSQPVVKAMRFGGVRIIFIPL
jgi:hypothetical protein